ncbi:hypothetical protein BV22DRAFT_1017803 [Leucogyrophana mollusca]|uniref:Uncharacterized protein n=1 Tax=Leucogyrophana mollusca TaxID=85980 RepID=A0ACB8B8M7_9AGAM|nr:hypothetical protein BV22DRAFT_1017803 [Leucogyrophana mollusca]
MNSTSLPSSEASLLLSEYTAVVHGRYMFAATATLVLYDHLIAIDDEVTYFWSGRWNISRVLYFSVSYMSCTLYTVFSRRYVSADLLVASISSTFTMTFNGSAALALRVWYLFTHNRAIQALVGVAFVLCTAATSTFASRIYGTPSGALIGQTDCRSSDNFQAIWRLYLPSIIFHSFLYILTLYRTCTSCTTEELGVLSRRIVDEGAPLYLIATLALVYTIVATSLTNNPEPVSNEFSCYIGSLVNGVISVTVCRAMLSLRNLATRLHVDPVWLLSHSELSRLCYRMGANDGELLVEVQTGITSALELEEFHSTRDSVVEPQVLIR